MFVLERWLFLLIRNLCLNCLKYMWKRLLLSYIIYCLWFLGVIVMTVLCGIDFLLLLSGVWLVAYEFHNSRSSLGWIFLSIQLLWGVALFIFIVSCGGSAQLTALVFNTANKSDWGIIFTCIATCLRIVMVSSSAEITIDQMLHVGENIFNLHWWKNVTILVVGLGSFNVKFVPSFMFFGGWNQWTDRY